VVESKVAVMLVPRKAEESRVASLSRYSSVPEDRSLTGETLSGMLERET
jgi:hypothetical protein